MQKSLSTLRAVRLLVIIGITTSMSFAQNDGHNDHGGRHHGEDWPDGLEVMDVAGTAIIDSSTWNPHYFLDTNANGEADYQLGFGPWWYTPDSGAERPTAGENITIIGGLIENDVLPILVVYQINDLFWRDSTGAPPWSGDWVHHGANDSTHVYCPTDSMSYLGFPPHSMMGMGFPDSLYCQFEAFDPDSMPGLPDSTHFAGFLCAFINPEGDHMGGGMGQGGMMNFSQPVGMQFHYEEAALTQAGLSEESITVWYMNAAEQWMVESAAQLNQESNIITISIEDIAPYYYLSAESIVSNDSKSNWTLPNTLELISAFPNPFNPSISIDFTLGQMSNVMFNVYNLKGQRVYQESIRSLTDGNHTLTWDPALDSRNNLGAGVYIVELLSGQTARIQKVTYLK
ncbi:T9SS type A sorting domain-containing protein [bacterium]|nr:T9SS type A sorting domain-containing protein [bacterium]